MVEPGTASWWLERPVWVGSAALVLVALVVALSPVERRRGPRPADGHVARRSVAAVAAFLGLAGLALAGFAHPFEGGRGDLLGVHLSPAASAVLLVGGWLTARGPAASR